jgi:hypothetical protein
MSVDSRDLLKFGLLTVALIAGWFALASVSHNLIVESLFGWVGLGVIAWYLRWLVKNKVKPPQS